MGQEECPRDEEGWERHLRQEGPEPCFGGYLRREVASSHRGHEEDLGLHQVAQAQRGPRHQARQRAGLSSRDLKSWTRVTVDGLRNLMILLDCVFYFCRRSGHAHSSGG